MRIAGAVAAAVLVVSARAATIDSLQCSLAAYKALPGLNARVADNALTLTWDGTKSQELRMRLGIDGGAPIVKELAVRRPGAPWAVLAENVAPDFRVVAGFRRMSNQQMQPLRELNVPITPAIIDEKKWDAFWDAPLSLAATGRGGNPPPAEGIANQPGLPRKADEIVRASAAFSVQACEVKTNGSRLEISFPGVRLGPFAGKLQYTVYKGTNLIRQEIVAATEQTSVAYKYDAGLKGLTIQSGTRATWRDIANTWQSYAFGGAANSGDVPLRASNRIVVIERDRAGSIAAFPPPHTFFWAREVATNLGYNWYRKDDDRRFSFGVRQAEQEETPQYEANFALYSARPRTTQRMAVYFYPSAEAAQPTVDAALAFTHGDKYKAIPGYQVMNHHYHMDVGQRLLRAGSLDADIPDFSALRSLGLNIISPIDSVGTGGGGRGGGAEGAGRGGAPARPDQLAITKASVEGARRNSDRGFVVMPNQEFYNSPLGGHTDLLFSHPVYWTQGRQPGQPLSEPHPQYGTVYHIASADDLIEMAKREDVLISMPHPRTKGSTGFPDAVKETAAFKDPHYQGVGFRWGMGVDLSEQRLCEYRCLTLLDDMSNWLVDQPTPLKNLLSISEVRYQQPGDDIYSSSPVTYVKLDALPTGGDMSPVIKALMRGDSWVTSGEVLINAFSLDGGGATKTITAEFEWTFPLEFVEVVWGDGRKTERQIISAAEFPAMGRHKFAIPFETAGKKWVRVAAWDSAGNGATTQPIKLSASPASSASR